MKDDEAAEVAAYIQRCGEELREQAEQCQGWPKPLYLPIPENERQKTALNMFIKALQEQTGAPVLIDFKRN